MCFTGGTQSSLARCLWMGTPTPQMLPRRSGGHAIPRRDYGRLRVTRLHYFYDWLENNTQRERLAWMTEALGGKRVSKIFHHE